MIVLLVGPSGTGKSAAVEYARPYFPEVVFESLDTLAPAWAEAAELIGPGVDVRALRRQLGGADDESPFLFAGLAAIGWLAGKNPGKSLVIDVGAGFLHAPPARHLHRLFTVVYFHADPHIAYNRLAGRAPDFDLSKYREAVQVARSAAFETAWERVDTTGLNTEQAGQALIRLLRHIFGAAVTGTFG